MPATDTPLPTIVTTSVARGSRVVVEMSRDQLDALVALVGNTMKSVAELYAFVYAPASATVEVVK